MSSGPILYPNISSLPSQSGVNASEKQPTKKEGVKGEFDHVFDKAMGEPNLEQVKAPLRFSAHASQRLRDRQIYLDPATMSKVTDAVDKAEAKGISDTLVLTKEAALIVNVPNRMVITAMDRGISNGNVFTNIDGAVIV